MSVINIKPISEIYLRVQGELKLLKIALINKDLKKIMSHRTMLHSLTTDFEISLKNNEKHLFIHYRIKEASKNLLNLAQATLHTASHYLELLSILVYDQNIIRRPFCLIVHQPAPRLQTSRY